MVVHCSQKHFTKLYSICKIHKRFLPLYVILQLLHVSKNRYLWYLLCSQSNATSFGTQSYCSGNSGNRQYISQWAPWLWIIARCEASCTCTRLPAWLQVTCDMLKVLTICQQSAGDNFIFDSLAGSMEMVINFINHHQVVRIFHLVEAGGFNAE